MDYPFLDRHKKLSEIAGRKPEGRGGDRGRHEFHPRRFFSGAFSRADVRLAFRPLLSSAG